MGIKKYCFMLVVSLMVIFTFSGCANQTSEGQQIKQSTEGENNQSTMQNNSEEINQQSIQNTDATKKAVYTSITVEEAKKIMEEKDDIIILDVRTKEEYEDGHIKDALLLPVDDIEMNAETILQDKEKTILVYCRSGRRSLIASEALVELGFQNVYEFGGIIDWSYEVVTD